MKVALPPAKTAFLLVLIAARENDRQHGLSELRGCCKVEQIAAAVGVMPGPGNRVGESVPGDTKRTICKWIRKKPLAQQFEDILPVPVVNPGWGRGYELCEDGIELVGLDLQDLVQRLRGLGPS